MQGSSFITKANGISHNMKIMEKLMRKSSSKLRKKGLLVVNDERSQYKNGKYAYKIFKMHL